MSILTPIILNICISFLSPSPVYVTSLPQLSQQSHVDTSACWGSWHPDQAATATPPQKPSSSHQALTCIFLRLLIHIPKFPSSKSRPLHTPGPNMSECLFSCYPTSNEHYVLFFHICQSELEKNCSSLIVPPKSCSHLFDGHSQCIFCEVTI